VIVQRRFIFPLALVFVVTHFIAGLPAQSNAPVLAIVGARIVDGSGNEPFDGTVVVRDGRIAEVGRTVRPPEGARIIDARGRTVTPGLIDVRVHLPAGATDDALARLMAAYLYAGVTSIGVADLDEAKVDALRDHLATAKIRGPRLVAATAPPGAMLASTLGSAVPDASALADWKKRNATFVPELVSAAASEKKSALDRLRAAQQAGVRIGVASNAGASNANAMNAGSGNAGASNAVASTAGAADLPAGTSTLREVRLLLDGGLTPLQALTAVTSGSAWALGLQSDRAFLAVGQRGDLAVLSGLPSATSADVALVEQVFVGGEEIDRNALNAIITRPEAAPPASTAAAGAANAASANKLARAGESSASAPAPGKPTLASARAAARAAKKGRGRPEATETANPVTTPATTDTAPGTAAPGTAATAGAAAASGTTANTATASPTLPTPPPTATATATTPAAPIAPAPANAATASGAATASAAPSPARSPMSSGTAAAAPKGAMAAGVAATAAAPIPVTDALIDDFEGAGGDRTGLGTTWNASNDNGSATDVIVGRVVRGLRDHALHLTARMGEAAEPYARITVAMARDGHPADVSQFHGLRFEARGQGRYRVVFVTRSVSDGRYHESFFSGSPLWTPVNIPFGTLGQTGPGSHVKWSGTDLIEIAFQFARDPGQVGWLELDNVRFY
jgi:cytosine/adenosine deaminase-related metal-dependent hydrolase